MSRFFLRIAFQCAHLLHRLTLGWILLYASISLTLPSKAESIISDFSFTRTVSYIQSSEKDVSLKEFQFTAAVNGSKGLESINSPFFATPKEDLYKLDWNSPSSWLLFNRFDRSEELEAAFPGGGYRLNLMDHGEITLQLPGSEASSIKDTPMFSGGVWEGGALLVEANDDYTFHFNEFTGFTSGTKIAFTLTSDESSLTNTFTTENTKETPTHLTLDSKSFREGADYYATLEFISITDQDSKSIDGATGTAQFANKTSIRIRAIPEPSTISLSLAFLSFGMLQALHKYLRHHRHDHPKQGKAFR